MSVLIKGMDMPKSCSKCPWWDVKYGRTICGLWDDTIDIGVDEDTSRPKWCPLVEVPPHGDLIDRNFVYSKIRIYADACYATGDNKGAKIAERIEELIRDVPTIIEAER